MTKEKEPTAQDNLTQMMDLFEYQTEIMNKQLDALNIFLSPTYSISVGDDGKPEMEIKA